jgi:hypothetical protein
MLCFLVVQPLVSCLDPIVFPPFAADMMPFNMPLGKSAWYLLDGKHSPAHARSKQIICFAKERDHELQNDPRTSQ